MFRTIQGANSEDIVFLNENQTTLTVTETTKVSIPSGGSLRLYMWVPGFSLTSGEKSIRFTYRDPIAGNYDIVSVAFYYTAESQYNPDSN